MDLGPLTDDGSDKGIPSPLHICDVFETELSVAESFTQRRQMHAQTAFLDSHVGPHPGNQRVLADDLAGPVDERHENLERPRPERNHYVRLFEGALNDVQLERTEQYPAHTRRISLVSRHSWPCQHPVRQTCGRSGAMGALPNS